jgi:hypothetical protein
LGYALGEFLQTHPVTLAAKYNNNRLVAAHFFGTLEESPTLRKKPSTSSVTRLGEISSVGRLFALGSFLKVAKLAQIFGLLFYPRSK